MKHHTEETAPAGSLPALKGLTEAFGWTPNVLRVFAGSPVLIQSYQAIADIIAKNSAFTAAEQEIIQVVNNVENDCGYCMAAHSTVIEMKGLLPADQLEALRTSAPLADAKQEALRTFALAIFTKQGRPSSCDIDAFKSAGYTDEHILEIVTHMAFKVITNYTNHLAEPELDEPFQAKAWTKAAPAPTAGG